MNQYNQPQIDLWNGRVGAKWAAMQISLDAMFAPATLELTARAGSVAGLQVLDIGCGNGETCVAWLNAGAQVTGVDVSEAMLAVAAARTAGQARLIRADAAVWKGEAPFDLAVSQFGLMFFADPDQAFRTIAANLVPGGRLLFTCWRDVSENQWVTLPMAAVHDLLPASSPALPHAPGPFALADRERLASILQRAGFGAINIDAFDFPVCVASEGGADAALRLLMQIGPTGAALTEADEAARKTAKDRLRSALLPHQRDGRVELGGAVWMVAATLE